MFKVQINDGCIEHKLTTDDFSSIFSRHMHENYEILFLIKGKAKYNSDDIVADLSPCDLVITPQHSYHCIDVDKTKPYERIVFNFSPSLFDIDFSEVFSKSRIINLTQYRELFDIFDRIIHYGETIKNEKDLNALIIAMLFELLINLKNTQFDNHVSKSLSQLASKIVAYIEDHIYEQITVEKMSEDLNVSKSHLQNTFIATMNIGVKSYIIMKKLDKARILLKNGERAIEVADKLGYKTYSSFYKSYIKMYGESPKDTR